MKKRLLIAAAVLCVCMRAQVPVAPISQPHVTFVDASGEPCAGCTFSSFVAGTTTPLATYTDSSGVSVNTNPIILDAAGGANIWLSNSSYKLILKSALGTTIWSVDNVKGGGGIGGICGPSGAIQIANVGINGLTCDSSITINTTNHTLNVGTLTASHVTITALGTPTSWTLDTTTPATALASLGGGSIDAGTANQIAIYPADGTVLQGSSSIPAGVTVTTQSPSDNSGNPASTAYVALPGAINPTSLQVATGSALTDNQGTGAKVQHSTGTTTPGNGAKFDADGNVVDAGSPYPVGTARTCNSNGCYQIDGDGTIHQWGSAGSCGGSGTPACNVSVTFPIPFTTTTNLTIVVSEEGGGSNNLTATVGPVFSSGFSVQYAALVLVGGGGGNLGTQGSLWYAVGN